MVAKIARNVVLVGLMGSGKSSLAKAIARKISCPALDTDQEIEKIFGKSITAIFADEGEEAFRNAETDLLKSWQDKSGYVISTGGGMIIRPVNRKIMGELGLVVWLEAPEKVLFERISRNKRRPLLQTENPLLTLRQLIKIRNPLYADLSDIKLDTNVFSRKEIITKILTCAAWNRPVT